MPVVVLMAITSIVLWGIVVRKARPREPSPYLSRKSNEVRDFHDAGALIAALLLALVFSILTVVGLVAVISGNSE